MGKKLIWKFNIIDLILIGLLLVSLIALTYKLIWGRDSNNAEPYYITCICNESPGEILNGVGSGMPCSDGDYGTGIGNLLSLSVSDIQDNPQAKRGVFVVEAEASREEHGIKVGDVLYLKGKEFNLIIGDSVFAVYLSDIQPVKQ